MHDENIDGLTALSVSLAIKRSGYYRRENSETGAVALFPDVKVSPLGSAEQKRIETEWEARAVEMHQNQVPVTLEAKPEINSLALALARSD